MEVSKPFFSMYMDITLLLCLSNEFPFQKLTISNNFEKWVFYSCHFRKYCCWQWKLFSSYDKQEQQVMSQSLNPFLLFPCSYRPGILDVSFIRSELALGSQEEDWQKFESSVSLAYTDVSRTKIDCKKSAADVMTQ